MEKETRYEVNFPDYDMERDKFINHWKPISREELRNWWKDYCQETTDDFKPTFKDFLRFQIGYVGALREAK